MSNMGLTDEQRKKIEENRRKALALKAKKSNSTSTSQISRESTSQFISINKASFIPTNKDSKNDDWKTTNTVYQHVQNFSATSSHNSNLKPGVSYQISLPYKGNSYAINKTAQTSNHVSHPRNSISQPNNSPSVAVAKEKFYGLPEKVIKGRCVLMSKDRFCVDVPYHGPLIEYFKQMDTRSYDTSSRNWSFQLKEYDRFLKGVTSFQPDIVLEPLPPIVIQTFCHNAKDNGIKEVDLSSVDNNLVQTLMPFQKEGVHFALQHGGRILLADEMGLGKTLQALCIASYYRSQWPLLIVTPSSVKFDWAQQIYKWLPSVDPQEVNVVDSGKGNVKEGLVSIISYDLMHKKVQDLKERKFKVIIMDESHFLKNSKAIRTKTAAMISKLAVHIILLSGTPALSRPSELFTQITAVCPTMFKFHDFGVRYCAAKQVSEPYSNTDLTFALTLMVSKFTRRIMQNYLSQPWGWDYSGSSNLEELQLLLEKKIMIRRQKSDVLQQLPDKTRQVIVLNPVLVSCNKEFNKSSKIMNKASLKGMERRGALLQYFHETGKAKLKAVKDFIMDLVESDKKFLVFAHHQEMMDCIEDAVIEHTKIKHIRIDGRTKSEQRSLLCKRFQTQEDYRVAILSIAAANAGLNLSAANLVVFAELFWNPGILVQAEDRVHRIGQKNSVSIQYLVARKTADDFIWPLVQDKLNILTKAGLTKDCFSNADTKHVMDTTQKNIMDMFAQNFIEESLPSSSEMQQAESVPCQLTLTPTKLKRGRSSSMSPSKCNLTSSPETPRKKQLRITKFLRTCEEDSSSASSISVKAHNINEDICLNQLGTPQDNQETDYNQQDGYNFDNDDDLEIIEEVKSQSSSHYGSQNLQEPVALSLDDCQALNDMSWDEEFWS